jgi:putative membrane protein
VNRQAQAVVLLLVGAAVLRAGSTDLYLRYVKAGLRPLLLAVGVILIIAAIATVWYELKAARTRRREQHGRDHHDSPGHAHHETRIAWLLVLPLFALILAAPPALGSFAANRTGTALQRPAGFPALPAGDPVQLRIGDYAARAAYDDGRSLADRRITITGFITVARGGVPMLTRMVLNCCAGDAQPIKVGLSGQVPPILAPDIWLEVTGTYTDKQITDDVNGGPIPFINVSRARAVPAPQDPYDG